mmetsp:Transcript_29437/g.21284  ORF Transcript_29437/g.21284 Transcript_29437/m.21284 type:complete len:122 (+) Transcript_29437:74-439(+)|eukprot:CAMPEP_0116871366 /NCGR_PEP_ID=MMETSP0463-20121206/1668_1 /TAXON_ID=181622 /ORGANISM="Strombidinopsis sp, Strain SopsisLIS2011" /LENGTH=121 /DNA_ID=CAMNT_0004509619 /DNA_START=30 /DNA_END=395 /DNA_ORIENTATION=-
MAHIDVASLTKTQHDELCCSYAALLLHDGELEISAEKISKVIKASGNQVEGYWPGLFAKALQGQDIEKFLTAVSSGASAPAASGAVATNNDAVAEEEDKKDEEPDDDVDADCGNLFGDDDY